MRRGLALMLSLLLAGCRDDSGGAAEAPSAASSAASSAALAESAAPSDSASAELSATPAPPKADPSRLALEGNAVQGGLMRAKVEPGTRGFKFPGHKVVIGEDGSFLIAFFYKAPAKETLTITFPDGAVLEHVFDVKQREYPDEAIDNMPERFFVLDDARKKRMRETNKRLEDVRNRFTDKAYYAEGCFVWPVTGRITSRYGYKRLFNKKHKDTHWGVDIAKPVGTRVVAPCGGIVSFAEADVPLAGNTVVIDHGHGLSSTLIHLQQIAVKVGDEVKPGALVGTIGMTGRTNGPHLDWRMNFFTIRLDPEQVAPAMPQ
jgi:murein DD-endopeptidase MepM/ murein hydrolase activator NlpD